jgi:hypothetical protein
MIRSLPNNPHFNENFHIYEILENLLISYALYL